MTAQADNSPKIGLGILVGSFTEIAVRVFGRKTLVAGDLRGFTALQAVLRDGDDFA
jgi:hypothetical protein